MTTMTNLDYAQNTYDVMNACSNEEITKVAMEEFLDQSEDTAGLVIGFILGKGVFDMEDILDYLGTGLADLTGESFVNSTWDLIDK